MIHVDLTLPTLAENLALDEALLLRAEAGGPEVLRFWNWPRLAVVLGAGGIRDREAEVSTCLADGVPIVRRSSGGGTVLLGPGCLCFSLVLAYDRDPALADLHASYRYILQRLMDGFASQLPGVESAGISDLVHHGRKFSGNAQQRKRLALLHHGTVLFQFELPRIARYLQHPPRMPDYRDDRPHLAFVANVPLSESALRACLLSAWPCDREDASIPTEWVSKLIAEKYGNAAWHERR